MRNKQMETVNVVLCLGSNCGDRYKNLTEAVEWLSGILALPHSSEIYETPPYSGSGELYLNTVVEGQCCLERGVAELEEMCKLYELSHGRDDEARRANKVPVDIDIVIADGKILRPSDYERSFFQIGFSQLSGH